MLTRLLILVSALTLSLLAYGHTRYIMDTDMGFDDWLAVTYLLDQPNIDIAAITVDCQGLSTCPAGGHNLRKLLQLTHRIVPIAMGKTRAKSPFDFPTPLRNFSSAMQVPGFDHLTEANAPLNNHAAAMIANTVIEAARHHQHVTIISIGTAINLANAWQYAKLHHQQKLFRQGLQAIIKGGGAFGDVRKNHISNFHLRGNISIPGIIQSNNTSAEWNIFANAKAMQALLAAKLPITFVPNNATDRIHMTRQSYQQLLSHSKPDTARRFNANAMLNMINMQGGWDKIASNLDFWDTSVTLATLNPALVVQSFHAIPLRVWLQPGPQYGATKIDTSSNYHANIWYRLNKQMFYKTLSQHLR